MSGNQPGSVLGESHIVDRCGSHQLADDASVRDLPDPDTLVLASGDQLAARGCQLDKLGLGFLRRNQCGLGSCSGLRSRSCSVSSCLFLCSDLLTLQLQRLGIEILDRLFGGDLLGRRRGQRGISRGGRSGQTRCLRRVRIERQAAHGSGVALEFPDHLAVSQIDQADNIVGTGDRGDLAVGGDGRRGDRSGTGQFRNLANRITLPQFHDAVAPGGQHVATGTECHRVNEVPVSSSAGIHDLVFELDLAEFGIHQSRDLLSECRVVDLDLVGAARGGEPVPRRKSDAVDRLGRIGQGRELQHLLVAAFASDSTFEDPLPQQPQLSGSERLGVLVIGQRRHVRLFLPRCHQVQQALVGLFGDDRRAPLSPLDDVLDLFEDQFALVDRHVVAGDAVLLERRIDVPFEIDGSAQLDLLVLDLGRLAVLLLRLLVGGDGHQQRSSSQNTAEDGETGQTTGEQQTHGNAPEIGLL